MTPLPYQKWQADVGHVFVIMQSGNTILTGGPGKFSAIDWATGEMAWEKSGIEMSRKSLALKDDVLVASPNPTEKEEAADSDTGVAIYSAVDGDLLWEEKQTPLLPDSRRGHFNRYLFVIDDTLFLPEARDLRTGRAEATATKSFIRFGGSI